MLIVGRLDTTICPVDHSLIGIITLHYITLHYITLHYITLHYITLHYITLHYITLFSSLNSHPSKLGKLEIV